MSRAPSSTPGTAPAVGDHPGFTPVSVLAVDLDQRRVEHPDPAVAPAHERARVLVRWLGDAVGVVDVTCPDRGAGLVDAVTAAAWQQLRPALEAVAARRGTPVPTAPGDLAGACAPAAGPLGAGTPAPLVTVTIASLRNVEPTVSCVRRVLSGSWPALEVVVVDNDDDPAPLAAALALAFGDEERVRWVHEPRRGLSHARNAGLAAARGDVVVFTDDDVRVDHRWVERLVEAFDAAPDVACVTGAILPAELETQAQAWLEEYGGFHKGFERQIFNTTTHRRQGPLYPYDAGQFGSGANMAFRREAITALGGFAVDLGAGTPAHGGEDLDVLRRTVSAGHTIVYEPSAIMWHFHRRSEAALRRQMYRYGVGLSATVAKWALEDHRVAVDIAGRLLPGLRHLLSPRSVKNEHKTSSFPSALTRLELLGMAVGPLAYLRSRHRASTSR